jgi:hypothetical protein
MSTASRSVGYIIVDVELFASAIWVACSLVLSNHCQSKPIVFLRGVAYLSVTSSTGGQLLAKTAGSALLLILDWQSVARFGTGMMLESDPWSCKE